MKPIHRAFLIVTILPWFLLMAGGMVWIALPEMADVFKRAWQSAGGKKWKGWLS